MGIARTLGIGALGLVLMGSAATAWVWTSAQATYLGPYDDIRGKDLPVPWPLTDEEAKALVDEAVAAAEVQGQAVPEDASELVDLGGAARTGAIARGEYRASAVGNCVECHGADRGGGIVMDEPMVMRFIAPNLTAGRSEGALTPEHFDRPIRHGVGPAGRAPLIPCIDFAYMADRDISDVVTYIQSLPPSDRQMDPSALGPVMATLLATGGTELDVARIDHAKARPELPPPAAADATWGAYIGQTCKGCHGGTLSGGKIPGGPPDWPAPGNLTPHESGLKPWSMQQFDAAVRHGVKPDGSKIHPAMPINALSKLEDRDVEALWAWVQTLEPRPEGNR